MEELETCFICKKKIPEYQEVYCVKCNTPYCIKCAQEQGKCADCGGHFRPIGKCHSCEEIREIVAQCDCGESFCADPGCNYEPDEYENYKNGVTRVRCYSCQMSHSSSGADEAIYEREHRVEEARKAREKEEKRLQRNAVARDKRRWNKAHGITPKKRVNKKKKEAEEIVRDAFTRTLQSLSQFK